MLLRKIDCEKVQNCGFSENWDDATCSMTNGSCHGPAPSLFDVRRYDTSPTSISRRRWPGNPNGQSKVRNLRLFSLARSQLMLCRWLRGWLRRLRDWRWLPEIAQTARTDVKHITSGSPAMTRIDRSSTSMQIYAYEIKQNLSKNIFLLLGCRYYDGIAHCFFPTITRNGFCSLLPWKIISRRPWPHQ